MPKKNIVDLSRATVALLNSQVVSERSKMFAFLSVFHPEMTLEERLEFTNHTKG